MWAVSNLGRKESGKRSPSRARGLEPREPEEVLRRGRVHRKGSHRRECPGGLHRREKKAVALGVSFSRGINCPCMVGGGGTGGKGGGAEKKGEKKSR